MTSTTESSNDAPPLIPVGDRARVLIDHPQDARLMTGDTVVVAAHQGRGEDQRYYHVRKITDADVPEDFLWSVMPHQVEPLHQPEPPVPFVPDTVERAEHDREVAALQRQIEHQHTERERLLLWQTRAQSDLQLLGRTLIEAANDNDMCGTYDEVIEGYNARCQVLNLPERSTDWSCSRRVQVSTWVTQYGTWSGRGAPDEDVVDWDTITPQTLREQSVDLEIDESEDFEYEVSE